MAKGGIRAGKHKCRRTRGVPYLNPSNGLAGLTNTQDTPQLQQKFLSDYYQSLRISWAKLANATQ